MPFLFVSKYEKRHRLESAREKAIQEIQAEMKCSREYAVRYFDYQKHLNSHNNLKLASSLLYMYGTHKLVELLAKDKLIILQKPWAKVPILTSGFLLGWVLYEKLVGHYLNWQDRDVAHLWEVDLQQKYGVHHDEALNDWESDLALTPYERLKKKHEEQLNKINVEGEKTYKRMGKDKNDFFYLFGKVRNLENILYVEKELEKKKEMSPVELQMVVDSVKPNLVTSGDPNKTAEKLHSAVEEYKTLIENSRNFRSVKDKMLGLPFMMFRHQQIPTPARGTWQFEIYEHMFGEPYDMGIYKPEIEEKVNKYNYHMFLHPSIIKKFDTNSEEFDMFLKKINIESNTLKEQRAQQREFFCKKILPILNLTDNKEVGYDYANYVMNKERNDSYGSYLYDQFSGQKEEKLFREAEEAKYINKNEHFVQRISYSQIITERIGVKPSELSELLNNPTKFKKMRMAVESLYPHYEPYSKIDYLKAYSRWSTFAETMLDRELDPSSPDFKIEDLKDMQYDIGEEENEEADAIMAFHANDQRIPGVQMNSYPYGAFNKSMLYYNQDLDWNDYSPDYHPTELIVSPKTRRFEMYNKMQRSFLDSLYTRSFNNVGFINRFDYIIPEVDYKNEELKSKVLLRSNHQRFAENMEIRDSEKEKLVFLETKTMEDSFAVSDDVTEEQLDQALFEASYVKPYFEMDGVKDIQKRNHREVEQLFKALNFEPHEHWFEAQRYKERQLNNKYEDKAQMIDPMFSIITEVEQPTKMRQYLKRWRSGAEMRFKLPYYPDTKEPARYFNYI